MSPGSAEDDGVAPMRLVTLNLQHGLGTGGGALDADALAAAVAPLAGTHVLALQEVDRGQVRSGGLDQAAVVAAALGLPHVRQAAALVGNVRAGVVRPDRAGAEHPESYGVALLSAFPVLASFAQPLPGGWVRWPRRRAGRWRVAIDEPRVALAAVLDVAGGPVSIATTHLSTFPATATGQLRRVVRLVRGMPGPRLVCGDLNLRTPSVRLATDLAPLARGDTYPSWAPTREIDHVLGEGWALPEGPGAPLPALDVADHRPVAVTLGLPSAPARGYR
ncbi:Endonuclease/exonuclease/phosphatase [Beutenbergia cavernae DSM 12333]|uniref:Endonuclease/exonuclease/phosphatase n=1 Tax=Beutenbergia cavernae (strain ATCC BAA-8 / DSM 12333 / CCUG 43141 / JCM 11478 / NBRC 16432 / NCIMB 13614 / HKI 0122) TaxID=471853 RepID=C5C297_BEUC1|nr:endonuclease/exonuclease/phosphatase family protein [Beutenbergia cavernae]ACQ81722.1 Endonuclease/exonuclease/phosphatase [Beutenbergia cavernae DSM 12333]